MVATGSFSDSVISSNGLYDIHNWNDVVLIAAGRNHVLGLHSDGTLEAIGSNESGMCNVDGWKLFQSLHTLEQERGRAAEQAERRKKEYAIMLSTEWNALQNELASLKGILAGIRRKEIEARLGDIQKELSKLKYRI